MTVRTTDLGDRLNAVTIRGQLPCGGELAEWFVGDLRIVDTPPAETVRGQAFLIRRPAPAGTLAGDIVARYGSAESFRLYQGTLEVSRLAARSARFRLASRGRSSTGEPDACQAQWSRTAQRSPGRLYVDATKDQEPVWIRRRLDSVDSVAVLIGFGTRRSGGAPSRSGLTCSRSSGRRAPSSSALTATSVLRMRLTGWCQVIPCRPSTSGGLLAPRPRAKRPSDARCRLAAAMAIAAGVRLQTGSTVVASPICEVLRRFARAPRQRRGSLLGGAEAGATELLGSHDEPNRLRRRRSGRRHACANSRTGLAPPVGRLCMSGVGAHQPRALAFQKWKSVVYGGLAHRPRRRRVALRGGGGEAAGRRDRLDECRVREPSAVRTGGRRSTRQQQPGNGGGVDGDVRLRRPTTLLPSLACHVGPPKWVMMSLPLSS
jgi:hypothetical protein